MHYSLIDLWSSSFLRPFGSKRAELERAPRQLMQASLRSVWRRLRDYLLEVIVYVVLYQGAGIQLGIELLDETVDLAVFNIELLRGASLGIDVEQDYHRQLLQHHVYQAVAISLGQALLLVGKTELDDNSLVAQQDHVPILADLLNGSILESETYLLGHTGIDSTLHL